MVDSVSTNRVHVTYWPSPPFPVRDIVLLPGLLPIFSYGCEIKSGRGLGTRLQNSCEWVTTKKIWFCGDSLTEVTKFACTCRCDLFQKCMIISTRLRLYKVWEASSLVVQVCFCCASTAKTKWLFWPQSGYPGYRQAEKTVVVYCVFC